ncbi:MAG: fucose isomerase [Clostridia bacterium]|nr:fucose isomerase [Clostridia bacterium]
MLKNVPKLLSPELLKILCEMGHGDELVIGDANFPSERYGQRVVRADGVGGAELLKAILTMIPLDTYAEPNFMLMALTPSDEGKVDPVIWKEYEKIAAEKDGNHQLAMLKREIFYERAQKAYAVVASGEEAIYANVIIKKGVIV